MGEGNTCLRHNLASTGLFVVLNVWVSPLEHIYSHAVRPTLKVFLFPLPNPVSPVWVGRSEYFFLTSQTVYSLNLTQKKGIKLYVFSRLIIPKCRSNVLQNATWEHSAIL